MRGKHDPFTMQNNSNSSPHVHNKNHNQFCGCNPSNRTQYSARFREYSARRGMVRSIQHLRQIVRVFLEFSVGQHHFDLLFFLARSMLKQWAIMSGVTSHAHIAFEISLLQPYYTFCNAYVTICSKFVLILSNANRKLFWS